MCLFISHSVWWGVWVPHVAITHDTLEHGTYPHPGCQTWDLSPHWYWHLVVATKTHMVGKRAVRILLECFLVCRFFMTLFEALYLIHQRVSRINIWKPCGLIEREIKSYCIGLNIFKAAEIISYLAG